MPRPNGGWDFISDAFYPDWVGGLQRYASELATTISGSEGPVTIQTRIWSDSGSSLLTASLPHVGVRELFPKLPRRIRGSLITSLSLLNLPLHISLVGRVRVAHTSIMGNLFFARRSDALQVYVFHASPALELRTKAIQSDSFNLALRFRVWVLRELERRCLSKADSVVVLSEFSKKILLQEYSWLEESDISVLPGGSDVAGIDAKTRRPGTSKRLIALRRLEWRTGVDLLLQAFSDSGIAEQGWELDVIGSGSLADELHERSKRLGIDEAVIFHGLVSEEEKSDLLSKAQLFVLPTRAFEGFGLATVEAMAHGLVPIVTSAGASPEIVGAIDPELICEPTVSGLTTALQLWTSIEYQDKIAEVSTRSSIVAAAYDWSNVGAQYLELVDTLAAKKVG